MHQQEAEAQGYAGYSGEHGKGGKELAITGLFTGAGALALLLIGGGERF